MLFVAAFSDEDPGVDQIAQRCTSTLLALILLSETIFTSFWSPSIIHCSISWQYRCGGSGRFGSNGTSVQCYLLRTISFMTSIQIPDNIALGTDECLQRCGLNRGDQPTAQRQPRVSANALPSGFAAPSAAPAVMSTPVAAASASAANGAPYSVPSSSGAYVRSTVYSTSQTSTSDHSVSGGISNGGVSITNSDGKPNALILSLIVVVGVLAAGYVALAVMYFYRRHQEKKSRMKGSKYFQTGSDFAPQGAIFEAEKAQPFEAYEGSSEARSTPYDPPSHS